MRRIALHLEVDAEYTRVLNACSGPYESIIRENVARMWMREKEYINKYGIRRPAISEFEVSVI